MILTAVGADVQKHLSQPNFVVPGTQSAREFDLQRSAFGSSISFAILLEGRGGALRSQGTRLAADLSSRAHYHVLDPWQGAEQAHALRVGSGRALLALSVDAPVNRAADIKPLDVAKTVRDVTGRDVHKPVHASVTGEAMIGLGLENSSLTATKLAELVAAPLLILILLIVFRSLVAAAIPLVIGGATVAAGLGVLRLATGVTPIDALATTFTSMLGLALGVDYSLLIVSRFREELRGTADSFGAASRASLTAGHTVRSAGGLLALGMVVAMAVLPGGILFSAAIGALIVTALAVLTGAFALPCALALIGPRVDRGRLPRPGWLRSPRVPIAQRVAGVGTRAPALTLLAGAGLLLLLATPAAGLRAVAPSATELPAGTPERTSYDRFVHTLGPGWGAPFRITVVSHGSPITRSTTLAALERFDNRLAKEPDVAFVAGPGGLASASRQLSAVPLRLQGLSGQIRRQRSAGERLSGGLDSADSGARALQQGFVALTAGASRLAAGSDQTRAGGQALVAGAAQAQQGAAEGRAAMLTLGSGADALQHGAQRAAAGARKLSGELSVLAAQVRRSEPQATALANGLHGGAAELRQLEQPAAIAAANLSSAYRLLQAMSVGKADSHYRDTVAAVATAEAAVTGVDPVDGSRIRAGYSGLPSSLDSGAAELDATGAKVSRTASQSVRLANGLGELSAGGGRLADGTGAIASGAGQLSGGLNILRARTATLVGGLGQLAGGSQRVETALGSIVAGAGELHANLAQGGAGAGTLEAGVGRMAAGVRSDIGAIPANGLGAAADASPGFYNSPYAVLAAADGAPSGERAAARYVVGFNDGGQAARMVVIPRGPVTSAVTGRLRRMLQRDGARLAAATGLEVAVGGEAAQVLDYQSTTMSRMLLLMVLLSLTNCLVMIVILRSLLLPLASIALNLLTVGAAFGVLRLGFQGAHPPLGGPGYIDTLALTGTFTVIFALSIDYQLFLLTRMREGFTSTGSNKAAVSYAVSHTAGIILGAAAIMIAIFAAFATGSFVTIRELGVGLTTAIVLDATVVRLMLLPAVVTLLGRRSWWLPRRAGGRSRALGVPATTTRRAA